MTIQNLIIKHKQFALNDFWKCQHLTFKIHNGSITLSLYTKDYKKTCKLQYSVDNGNNWNDVIKVEKKSAINDNECKAKYTIGTFDNSVKLRGNVLIENSNQWGVFSVKCNNGATYDVCGNPASLYSIDSFASVRTIDLSNLFANREISDNKELYYDDNELSWKNKDSGTNKIFTKESSNIKYGGESVYGDNGLLSIKNLWLQHPNGTYTNMFIGSNVKTITDYMPISGRCGGMFYSSQITSDDLKLQLPSIQNYLYEGMFAYCPNIKNITVNNIQNKDIYAGMFLGCKNLEKINVTYSNITNSLSKTIKSMFFECSKINQFNITFDNISVPEFDEYFRFTIPSTLTDCSESELNILNSEATTSVYKLFYNSKIETAPATICNNGVYPHLFDQQNTNIHSIKIICNSLSWFNNSDIFGSGPISSEDNGNKKIEYLDVSECNEFSKTIFQRIQLSDYNYIPTVKINKNIDPTFITRTVGALNHNGWIAKAATNIIHKDDLNNTYTIYNDIFKNTRFKLIQLAEKAQSGLKIILNYNNYVKYVSSPQDQTRGHPNHIAINPFNDNFNRKNFLEGFRHEYQNNPQPSLFRDNFNQASITGYNNLTENIPCQIIVEFNEKITITFKQQNVQVLQFSTSSGNEYNEIYKGKPLSIGNTNSSIENCQVYLNESLINTYIPIKWEINNEYISGLLDSNDMIYH